MGYQFSDKGVVKLQRRLICVNFSSDHKILHKMAFKRHSMHCMCFM